jgi:glycosyltransferase involved in cell wall biosynthesis
MLTGHVSEPERFVALADVCVLASMREGLPRVIVQSLAAGKPAVVSPVAGIEEIVRHDFNGLIVSSSEAEEVARVAVRLVQDDANLTRLTSGARQSNVQEWSFDSMFAGLDSAYAKLVMASISPFPTSVRN